jgi:hypothetical protein
MTHSLTDEMCEELSPWYIANFDEYDADRIKKGMRAAYDKGDEDRLEQVIRYLENDLEFVLWSDDFMDKFKKAMRPQQQQENNS